MGQATAVNERTPQDWHSRFLQQARWSEQVRRFLFAQFHLEKARRGLEVGCGTGAIADAFQTWSQANIHGVDIRADFLEFARLTFPHLYLVRANGLQLPYADRSFDFSFCHYFLLWVADPLQAIKELQRVTRPGGAVLALAEPDYGGRIDYPEPLAEIGRLQAQALRAQGAETEMGRRLACLFHTAGLQDVHAGVLGGVWGTPPAAEEIESEWSMLSSDLVGEVPISLLKDYRCQDLAAWQKGERVLYIPTFYAWGLAG